MQNLLHLIDITEKDLESAYKQVKMSLKIIAKIF